MATRATAQSATASTRSPSLTRVTNLGLTEVNQLATDLAAQSLVWGTAAAPPATYADLGSPHKVTLEQANVVFNTVLNRYDLLTVLGATIAGTPGDHLWVGYVGSTGTPISGTTIDQVADAGAIVD